MIKYAKIINHETKECQVGIGTNVKFYQSIGMVEMDVEQAYNGQWYVAGYAPEKPLPTIEEMQASTREVRDLLLSKTDKYVLSDFPITDADLNLMKKYRTYLRDYTNDENWWLVPPLDYDGWNELRIGLEAQQSEQKTQEEEQCAELPVDNTQENM